MWTRNWRSAAALYPNCSGGAGPGRAAAPAPGGRGSVLRPPLREAPLGAEPGTTMAGRGRALLALLALALPAWAPDPVSLAGHGEGGRERIGPGLAGGMRPPPCPRREAGRACEPTRGEARRCLAVPTGPERGGALMAAAVLDTSLLAPALAFVRFSDVSAALLHRSRDFQKESWEWVSRTVLESARLGICRVCLL